MKQIWDFIHGRDHLTGTLRYAELKPESLLLTLEKLHQRISERFPQSGLSQVAAELNEVAASIVQLTERLRNPCTLPPKSNHEEVEKTVFFHLQIVKHAQEYHQ